MLLNSERKVKYSVKTHTGIERKACSRPVDLNPFGRCVIFLNWGSSTRGLRDWRFCAVSWLLDRGFWCCSWDQLEPRFHLGCHSPECCYHHLVDFGFRFPHPLKFFFQTPGIFSLSYTLLHLSPLLPSISRLLQQLFLSVWVFKSHRIFA